MYGRAWISRNKEVKSAFGRLVGERRCGSVGGKAKNVAGQAVGFGRENEKLRGRVGVVLVNAALVAVSEIYREGLETGLGKFDLLKIADDYISGFRDGVLADKDSEPLLSMMSNLMTNNNAAINAMEKVKKLAPGSVREKMGSFLEKQITSELFWIEGYLAGALVNNMKPGIERVGIGTIIGRFSSEPKFRLNAARTIEVARKMGKAFGISDTGAVDRASKYCNFVREAGPSSSSSAANPSNTHLDPW